MIAEVITALTRGSAGSRRKIRARGASFQKFERYPDQARAVRNWIGGAPGSRAARAKQVFGRLTAGEHRATQDQVLAWSHVYLARDFDDEGIPK